MTDRAERIPMLVVHAVWLDADGHTGAEIASWPFIEDKAMPLLVESLGVGRDYIGLLTNSERARYADTYEPILTLHLHPNTREISWEGPYTERETDALQSDLRQLAQALRKRFLRQALPGQTDGYRSPWDTDLLLTHKTAFESIVPLLERDEEPDAYLALNHPDQAALERLTYAFARASLNLNYRTTTGEEIVPFLSQAALQRYRAEFAGEQLRTWLHMFEIVMRSLDFWYWRAVLNEQTGQAWVQFQVKMNVDEAADDYLALTELDQDGGFIPTLRLALVKEAGEWKVDRFPTGGPHP